MELGRDADGIRVPGRLPATTSADDARAWMFGRDGRLIEVELATGASRPLWAKPVEDAVFLRQFFDERDPLLVAVNAWGGWTAGRASSNDPESFAPLDLQGGEVAACRPCPSGLLLLVVHASHASARLVEAGMSTTGAPYLGVSKPKLEFGYKPRTGLAVIAGTSLAVAPYGEGLRDCVLIDYRSGEILRRFTGPRSFVEACCVIESRDLLLIGSQDGEVHAFRLSSGALADQFQPGIGQIRSIHWAGRHDCVIVSGGTRDEEHYLTWNLKTGTRRITSFAGRAASAVVVSGGEDFLLSGALDQRGLFERGDDQRGADTVAIRRMVTLVPPADVP